MLNIRKSKIGFLCISIDVFLVMVSTLNDSIAITMHDYYLECFIMTKITKNFISQKTQRDSYKAIFSSVLHLMLLVCIVFV